MVRQHRQLRRSCHPPYAQSSERTVGQRAVESPKELNSSTREMVKGLQSGGWQSCGLEALKFLPTEWVWGRGSRLTGYLRIDQRSKRSTSEVSRSDLGKCGLEGCYLSLCKRLGLVS